jgi:hypothetical protein
MVPSARRSLAALRALLGAGPLLLALGGCTRSADLRRAAAVALPVNVFADTGRGERLSVEPPPRVWLARVTPERAATSEPALPEALPDSAPPVVDEPPALEVDPGLTPPALRVPGVLDLPAGRARGSVELEVRVDESGAVSEAAWAAGRSDTALIAAARRCALGMRFYPARRAGRPVAVWCRQRFDFEQP